MNCKFVFAVCVILFLTGFRSYSQSFPYSANLRKNITETEQSELRKIAEKNWLYSGNLTFNIAEADLDIKEYNPDSTWFTIGEAVQFELNKLKTASETDSVEIYLNLYDYYNMLGDGETGIEMARKSYDVLQPLLNADHVQPEALRQAGFFAAQVNGSLSQAFPYFDKALKANPSDSASLQMMITIFYQYGLFDQSDSMINIAVKRFPDAVAPYLLKMQIESMRLLMKASADSTILKNKSLREVVNFNFIDSLRANTTSEKHVLLSYLLEEFLLITKYNSNISGDAVTELHRDDAKALIEMRTVFNRIHNKNKDIPAYTTSKALAWSYAVEHKTDKALQYLETAMHEAKNMGGHYLDARENLYNTLLAIQYIGGDTREALKTTEKLIAASDSLGYNAGNYCMQAVFQLKLNQYDQSLLSCAKAEKYRADKTTVNRLKAMNYFFQDKKDEAFAEMDASLKTNEKEASNYAVYGILHLINNNPAEAIRYLEAAWYASPNDPALILLLDDFFAKK